MTQKESHFIRLKEIAKMAAVITSAKIIDQSRITELHKEVNAMLRHLSSTRRFFKRLS